MKIRNERINENKQTESANTICMFERAETATLFARSPHAQTDANETAPGTRTNNEHAYYCGGRGDANARRRRA